MVIKCYLLPGLSHSVASVLCLFVVVRVEVEVVKYHSVGGAQVDPQTARFRRQDEDENVVITVELVNQHLSTE